MTRKKRKNRPRKLLDLKQPLQRRLRPQGLPPRGRRKNRPTRRRRKRTSHLRKSLPPKPPLKSRNRQVPDPLGLRRPRIRARRKRRNKVKIKTRPRNRLHGPEQHPSLAVARSQTAMLSLRYRGQQRKKWKLLKRTRMRTATRIYLMLQLPTYQQVMSSRSSTASNRSSSWPTARKYRLILRQGAAVYDRPRAPS